MRPWSASARPTPDTPRRGASDPSYPPWRLPHIATSASCRPAPARRHAKPG
ncbi:hypothetical protein I552_1230 [Mycobacterium xenopi 3993]|nr:hypothetical protein I552_1230 [Mycobacterium xenopi 3993]